MHGLKAVRRFLCRDPAFSEEYQSCPSHQNILVYRVIQSTLDYFVQMVLSAKYVIKSQPILWQRQATNSCVCSRSRLPNHQYQTGDLQGAQVESACRGFDDLLYAGHPQKPDDDTRMKGMPRINSAWLNLDRSPDYSVPFCRLETATYQ
jgi:hypothetical protein